MKRALAITFSYYIVFCIVGIFFFPWHKYSYTLNIPEYHLIIIYYIILPIILCYNHFNAIIPLIQRHDSRKYKGG